MDTKEQIINELATTLYGMLEPKRYVHVRRDHGCWELWVETSPPVPPTILKPKKLIECTLAEKPEDERVYITIKGDYDNTKVVRLSDPDWIDNFLTNTVFFLAHVP